MASAALENPSTAMEVDDDSTLVGLDGESAETETVNLILGSTAVYNLPKTALRHSVVLSSALDDPNCTEITLLFDAPKEAYDAMVEFLLHYANEGNDPKELPPKIERNNLHKVVPEWDWEFIHGLDVKTTLQQVQQIANYYNMKPLLNLSSAMISVYIHSKLPDEIFDILGWPHSSDDPKEDAEIKATKEYLEKEVAWRDWQLEKGDYGREEWEERQRQAARDAGISSDEEESDDEDDSDEVSDEDSDADDADEKKEDDGNA